ncbi:MAG: ABC transporter permease subunit [Candidatus Aminicenantes bacterium]|nr:ABC transporter permease subunit [Candidatus Aminicenantes bacterium]
MFDLFLYEIRSRWKAILGWGFGLVLFGAIYISVLPSIFEQMKYMKDLSIYQLVGLHLGSIEGYLASVILVYISILLGIYCITAGTATLAEEEDNGTLELIMSMPLSRWQIGTAKAAALSAVTLLIMIIAAAGNAFFLALLRINHPINVTPFHLFAALMSSLPLAWALIMIGLFFGAVLPNRRFAAAMTTLFFIAGFFGENIASMVKTQWNPSNIFASIIITILPAPYLPKVRSYRISAFYWELRPYFLRWPWSSSKGATSPWAPGPGNNWGHNTYYPYFFLTE